MAKRFITSRIVPGSISLDQIRKNVTVNPNSVKVGLPDSPYAEGLTLAALGAIHEYGVPSKGIPQRPFLFSAISEGRQEIARLSEPLLRDVQLGTITKADALGKLGELGVGLVQEKIRERPFTPNAPSTISKKGSTSPLLDTGQMRASVSFAVEK